MSLETPTGATETGESVEPDTAVASETLDVGILTSHMSFDQHGGSNFSRHVIAQELEKRGHDVTIYTLNFADENHVPVNHEYSIEETPIDARTIVGGVGRFFRQIRKYFESSDVVHVYSTSIVPLVGMYKSVTGDETPVVATLNNYSVFCTNSSKMKGECWADCSLADKIRHSRREPTDENTPGDYLRFTLNHVANSTLLNQIDRFFCLSPSIAEIYGDIGVNRRLLDVVPNMLDQSFPAENTSIPTDETRILYAGRIDEQKGIGNLINALLAVDVDTEYHVDVVGANTNEYGKTVDDWRTRITQLALDDTVTFHGWVDYQDLPEYYARADIFVHPANMPEPFGRTILEAMQHELPIVCSDVGAVEWVSGMAGLSYPRDEPEELARTLGYLLENPARRANLRQNTHLELERFQPDVVVRQIESKYQEVLA